MEDTLKTIKYDYIFYFPNGTQKQYNVEIDYETKTCLNTNTMVPDNIEWTDLEFHQCDICPLEKKDYIKCPVAWNLYTLVESFQDQISFEEVDVEIQTPYRTYKKSTSLQIALQSLFGVLMATSNCPILKFLSPMALFHLPFASFEETILRAASFYLLQQYFYKSDGLEYDFSMKGLKKKYEEVERVNQDFLSRIQEIDTQGDASLNAITTLNAFAQMFSIQYGVELEALRHVFK